MNYADMRERAENAVAGCAFPRGSCNDGPHTLARDILALLAEVARKDAALARYGRHDVTCSVHNSMYLEPPDPPCHCGFQAALAPIPEKVRVCAQCGDAWVQDVNGNCRACGWVLGKMIAPFPENGDAT